MSYRRIWMWQRAIAWAEDHGENEACLFRPGFEYRWTVQLPDYDIGVRSRNPQVPVYVVVCAHFHRAQPDGAEVAHSCRGGDQGCFAPAHLRWATRAVNLSDKIVQGTQSLPAGWRRPKLTEAEVRSIRARRAAGERGVDLAAEFGVSQPTISMIVHRTNWAWLHDPEG